MARPARATLAAAGSVAAALMLLALAAPAFAHNVASGDRAFVAATQGPAVAPFLYLGAKHMVTGYDHILFLVGVVLFLRRLRDVVLFVSLFTIGHSTTLLLGVLFHTGANSHVVDAIIGLSVAYKGTENLGWLRRIGWTLDTRIAVLAFGLCHGLGLATKLLSLQLSRDGLIVNLLSFNLGVEIGQILVLAAVVALLDLWRDRPGFARGARFVSIALVGCGLVLFVIQTREYLSA